jgi:predicted transposase YbfD/YdcC
MVKKIDEDVVLERQEEIIGFIRELNDLKDPRSKQGRSFSLAEIFLLVLCAQICGFESLREYEAYGGMKINLLKQFLRYNHGHPSKSTICRVLSLFEPDFLEAMFMSWMELIVKKEDRKHIAIDGKTHCGFRKEDKDSLHLVHAYSAESGLVLGQEKVSDKSNEITAIPRLLNAMHIEKQIVTIDAMGCQKEIAKVIRDRKADYVLGLKGNHSDLHEDVALYFKDQNLLKRCTNNEKIDKGHGRFEIRRCYVSDQIDWLECKNSWKDLRSIACVETLQIQKCKETREVRYFISSLPANPDTILRAVRAHWGVESMHWCLDVIFREDDRIIWNKNFARNEAIIRRCALNLIKKFQDISSYRIGKAKMALKTIRKLLVGNDDNMTILLQGVS